MRMQSSHIAALGGSGLLILGAALVVAILQPGTPATTGPDVNQLANDVDWDQAPSGDKPALQETLPAQNDSQVGRKDTEPPEVEPEPKVESDNHYGTGMTRGAKRLALTKPVPLDWIRQCLAATDVIDGFTIDCSLLTPEILELIGQAGIVQEITFVNAAAIGPEAGAALGKLAGVASVALDTPMPVLTTNSTATEADFTRVAELFLAMPDVKRFQSHGEVCVTDGLLSVVGRFGHLRRLSLRNYPDLRRANQITTNGLLELGQLTQLEELILSNFTIDRHKIDLSQLATLLNRLPNLKKLSLSGWSIQDTHLQNCVDSLRGLHSLNVRNTLLTARFFVQINDTWRLEELVTNDAFDSDAAGSVAQVPNLKMLDIASSKIDDVGLSKLGQAGGLIRLNLRACSRISDGGLLALQPLSQLLGLHVSGNSNLTPGALRRAVQYHKLRELGVSDFASIDAGYLGSLISECPSLEVLFVWRCKLLDKQAIESLSASYPSVAFRRVPYAPSE